MVKKFMLVMLVALVLLTVGVSISFAAPFYEGRPSQFDPGESSGFFIWRDDRGWHVTTTAAQVRQFSGTIRTDGEIRHVKSARLERNDAVRSDYKKDVIKFEFLSGEKDDGIVFNISGGSYVHFELYMDHRRVDPRNVYVGKQNWRPAQSPFRIDLY